MPFNFPLPEWERETAYTFQHFPVGTRVRVVSRCVDFMFFKGVETGTVVKNTGQYLGIHVAFDPRYVYWRKGEPAWTDCHGYEHPAIPDAPIEWHNFGPENLEPLHDWGDL